MGTWIEIYVRIEKSSTGSSRSLRGNVDRNNGLADFVEVDNLSFPTWERG